MPNADPMVPALPPAQYVQLEDCALAYFTLGAKGGTPIVLCHGLAASSLQFVADAHWFAAQGFYVVVPDIRGHGRSELKRPAADIKFSVPILAKDMLAILDTEKLEAVHWVGNSLGGIIALEIMGQSPERLKSFVSFGTSYHLGLPQFAVAISGFLARMAGRDAVANILAPLTCRDAKGRAVIAAMIKQVDIDAAVAVADEVRSYNLIGNAKKFSNPILMLRGSFDTQVNMALGSTLNAMTPNDNFTLIDVADAGHCANLDQPELCREKILSFIEDI